MRSPRCLGSKRQVKSSVLAEVAASEAGQGRPSPPLPCSSALGGVAPRRVCVGVCVCACLCSAGTHDNLSSPLRRQAAWPVSVGAQGWEENRGSPKPPYPKSSGPARHNAHCHFLPSVPSDGDRASKDEWALIELACRSTHGRGQGARQPHSSAGLHVPAGPGSGLEAAPALPRPHPHPGKEGYCEPQTLSSHRQGPEFPIRWDKHSKP